MISSAAFLTSSPPREMTPGTKREEVEVRRNGPPAGMPEPWSYTLAASETRRQILRLLQQGVRSSRGPREELGDPPDVRRLSSSRSFFRGPSGRSSGHLPTERATALVFQVTHVGRILEPPRAGRQGIYRRIQGRTSLRELEDLESKLAAGDIAEEMYFKRRKELRRGYSLAL